MFKNLNIQEYLSLGYLCLVVLGVVSESVFYGFLGIPYLQYTSILDVLMSPISLITDNLLLLVMIIVFSILFLLWIKKMPQIHKKNKHKKWYRKINNVEKLDKKFATKSDDKGAIVLLVYLLLFSMLIGFRAGLGGKYKQRLEEGKFEKDYTIVFKDNAKLDVKKIGQNSLYIFYVQEGEKVVTATPILDNVKQIKRIKKDEK